MLPRLASQAWAWVILLSRFPQELGLWVQQPSAGHVVIHKTEEVLGQGTLSVPAL